MGAVLIYCVEWKHRFVKLTSILTSEHMCKNHTALANANVCFHDLIVTLHIEFVFFISEKFCVNKVCEDGFGTCKEGRHFCSFVVEQFSYVIHHFAGLVQTSPL